LIVYAITNLVNGKRYIGLTEKTLGERWVQHKSVSKRGVDTFLYKAIRKYGEKAFAICELARLPKGSDRALLCSMEQLFIFQENTLSPNGYNMTPGGDGLTKGKSNPNFGRKASEGKLEKLRNAWTPERRIQASIALKEIRSRPGHLEKLRAGSNSEASKAKQAAAWTPERREIAAARMLANTKIRKETPENIEARNKRIVALAKSDSLRKINSERMKKYRADHPERNAAHSEWMKKMWADRRSTLQ